MTARKNPAAVALGRLGGAASKGVAKSYSPEEIAKRTERIKAAAEARRKKAKAAPR